MRKIIVYSLVLALCLLGAAQLVAATETAESPAATQQRSCFLNLLDAESRKRVEALIQEYNEKKAVLREMMQEHRVAGQRDELAAAREEMWDLKEERQKAIAEALPEEYREEYLDRGFGRQRMHRPGDDVRAFEHGWEKHNNRSMTRAQTQL